MSRRQLSLVAVTIASLVLTACGTSPTAPQPVSPIKAAAPQLDATDAAPTIGTVGSF